MPYIDPEVITEAKQMDLFTYLLILPDPGKRSPLIRPWFSHHPGKGSPYHPAAAILSSGQSPAPHEKMF